ncbi:MAG: ECF transporter S component [Leucobacter sp.]
MKNITTRYLLTCAVIGVGGGLLLMPVFIIFSAAAVAAAPIVYAVVVGVWFLPGALAQNLLRRGGAALLTMLIAGLVSVPFTPYGWAAVASTLTVGVLQEVPFVFTLWRYWKAWLVYLWALVIGVAYAYLLWGTYGAGILPDWMLAVMMPVVVVSALLFTWLGRYLAGRVARTGVARGLQPPTVHRSAPKAVPVEDPDATS